MERNERKSLKRPRIENIDDCDDDYDQHRNHRPTPTMQEHNMTDKEKHELERSKRMARLRAENDDEEKKLAAVVDEAVRMHQEGRDPSRKSIDKNKPLAKQSIMHIDQEELDEMDEEEQMQHLFGFGGGFSSTKGKAVEDNQNSASRGVAGKNKARKYRQYMNRKGGFNRPLEKMN
jgi:U4/U6.U5 tri-snRNP-associated protein 3